MRYIQISPTTHCNILLEHQELRSEKSHKQSTFSFLLHLQKKSRSQDSFYSYSPVTINKFQKKPMNDPKKNPEAIFGKIISHHVLNVNAWLEKNGEFEVPKNHSEILLQIILRSYLEFDGSNRALAVKKSWGLLFFWRCDKNRKVICSYNVSVFLSKIYILGLLSVLVEIRIR